MRRKIRKRVRREGGERARRLDLQGEGDEEEWAKEADEDPQCRAPGHLSVQPQDDLNSWVTHSHHP